MRCHKRYSITPICYFYRHHKTTGLGDENRQFVNDSQASISILTKKRYEKYYIRLCVQVSFLFVSGRFGLFPTFKWKTAMSPLFKR